MLPIGSSMRGGTIGAGTADGGHSSGCVRVRRLLVSSLPPSPVSAVACPAMLLFVAAFYALHTLLLMLWSRAELPPWSQAREHCPELLGYSSSVAGYAGLLALVHMAQVLPNMLAKCEALRGGAGSGSGEASVAEIGAGGGQDGGSCIVGVPSSSSSRVHTSPARRLLLRLLWLVLTLMQRVLWCDLLASQLHESWLAFRMVDRTLEQHKAAAEAAEAFAAASSLVASGSSVGALQASQLLAPPECGLGPSKHLLRWSLVCVVVSSGLAISLLLAAAEDGFVALRQRCRFAREATLRARRMHLQGNKQGARAAAWRACCMACCAGLDVTAGATPTASSGRASASTPAFAKGPRAFATAASSSTASGNPAQRWLDLQPDELPEEEEDVDADERA